MKPGDHPEFFRFPAPAGRSRESTIRLDGSGIFWHDGQRVDRASMRRAFFGWIRRHPDDGRYILSNGYDWTYLTVDDVPLFVDAVRLSESNDGPEAILVLSDGSEERLEPKSLRVGQRDALYVSVREGQLEARFMPSSQNALAPLLVELEGEDGIGLRQGKEIHPIPLRPGSTSAKKAP